MDWNAYHSAHLTLSAGDNHAFLASARAIRADAEASFAVRASLNLRASAGVVSGFGAALQSQLSAATQASLGGYAGILNGLAGTLDASVELTPEGPRFKTHANLQAKLKTLVQFAPPGPLQDVVAGLEAGLLLSYADGRWVSVRPHLEVLASLTRRLVGSGGSPNDWPLRVAAVAALRGLRSIDSHKETQALLTLDWAARIAL